MSAWFLDAVTGAQNISWRSKRDLSFHPDGRCTARFPVQFPFLMHFYNDSANYNTPPNFHDYLEVFIVWEGKGVMKFAERQYEFNTGDVFFVGSNEVHNVSHCYDQNTKTIELYFMPELIYNPGSNREDFYYLLPFYHHNEGFVHQVAAGAIDLEALLRQVGLIFQELRNRNAFYQLAVKNHFRDLLLILCRYHEQRYRSHDQGDYRVSNLRRLRTVAGFIKENYQEELSLASVADTVSLSPEYFCRFFKQATGLTLTDYLHRFRIAKAIDLLEHDEMPITHVAYEVGFGNYSYFQKVFKRLTGMCPRTYRAQLASADHGEREYSGLLGPLSYRACGGAGCSDGPSSLQADR